jgi:tRNA threonylcarbamoyladenosine modification (KEOPS) complex  Pcc1 subunit
MLQKLKKLKEKNMAYHTKMRKMKNKEEMVTEDLGKSEATLIHPYLNPDCAFYQKKTNELVLEVEAEDKAKFRPFGVDDDLELIELTTV